MYLVSRIYSGMDVCFGGDPTVVQELITCDNGLIDSGYDAVSPHLRLQLQKHRAEKRERERSEREVANTLAFEESETKALVLAEQILLEIRAKKRRKCTLQYMQTVVAGLERTLLEVKGLNAVAAGRTCQ
jgi:hypothetical protein